MNYTGPATADSVTFTSIDEFTVQVPTPGIYTITAEVTDASSNIYTDSYAILAIDGTALDALLQSKWDGMKAALSAQDIQAALTYFSPDTYQFYNDAFTLISDSLPQLISEMQSIQLIYSEDNQAEYRLKRDELIAGQTYSITYFIYFTKDDTGLWKILRY